MIDPQAIEEKLAGYRASRDEWIRRRASLLQQAEQALANANACNGAIEALETLIPAPNLEDVVSAAGGVIDLPKREGKGNASK